MICENGAVDMLDPRRARGASRCRSIITSDSIFENACGEALTPRKPTCEITRGIMARALAFTHQGMAP